MASLGHQAAIFDSRTALTELVNHRALPQLKDIQDFAVTEIDPVYAVVLKSSLPFCDVVG